MKMQLKRQTLSLLLGAVGATALSGCFPLVAGGMVISGSIVPVSHYRAMLSAVRSAATIIMITGINPGNIKLRETMSALNQIRGRSWELVVGKLVPYAVIGVFDLMLS